MFSRPSEFVASIGAPLLAIAAYTTHLGIPVGAPSTILAAVLTGAAVPVVDRFLFLPAMDSLGLREDKVLEFAGGATLAAATGLAIAGYVLQRFAS